MEAQKNGTLLAYGRLLLINPRMFYEKSCINKSTQVYKIMCTTLLIILIQLLDKVTKFYMKYVDYSSGISSVN